jgi:opacity protein-like surface antigen
MSLCFGRWTVLTVLGVAAASPASAQVLGIPIHNSGIPTGVGIVGEVGFPNADAGKGTAFGATGLLGVGPIGFTASVASYNPKGPGSNITSYGATGNLKVFGGPLIPLSVTLQGGVGYFKVGTAKDLHVPVGLGIALNIPNPALAIKPWIAPRLDVERVSVGSTSNTSTDFGLSAGIDFNLLGGLGFRASYDWVSRNGAKPAVFGLGASYIFKVPGL